MARSTRPFSLPRATATGRADRSIQVLARLARHGANFNRKFGGLFKFPRPFSQASGNATDPIALEASVKRRTAESRDRRLQVSQASVEREARVFADDD